MCTYVRVEGGKQTCFYLFDLIWRQFRTFSLHTRKKTAAVLSSLRSGKARVICPAHLFSVRRDRDSITFFPWFTENNVDFGRKQHMVCYSYFFRKNKVIRRRQLALSPERVRSQNSTLRPRRYPASVEEISDFSRAELWFFLGLFRDGHMWPNCCLRTGNAFKSRPTWPAFALASSLQMEKVEKSWQ